MFKDLQRDFLVGRCLVNQWFCLTYIPRQDTPSFPKPPQRKKFLHKTVDEILEWNDLRMVWSLWSLFEVCRFGPWPQTCWGVSQVCLRPKAEAMLIDWTTAFLYKLPKHIPRSGLSATYLSIYLSIYLSVCLSVCLPIYLSIYLSVCLSVCLSTYLSIYLSISVCLSVYLSIYLSIYLVCLSTYLSIYLSICLSVCLPIYLSIYLSVCLSTYLSICLSVYLSIYLSVCLSTYLSIYLSI